MNDPTNPTRELNFACIYREQYLIVDEDSHHREIIESVRVTAHEIGKTYLNRTGMIVT